MKLIDQPVTTSIFTCIGTLRPTTSPTGEFRSTHSTIPRSVSSETFFAPSLKFITIFKGPAGIALSISSILRPSEVLLTSTSSVDNSIPSSAARMAAMVASQFANAARNNQPGPGALASPPMPFAISDVNSQPCGPVALQRNPLSTTAVAGASSETAFSGYFENNSITLPTEPWLCSTDLAHLLNHNLTNNAFYLLLNFISLHKSTNKLIDHNLFILKHDLVILRIPQ